MPYQTKQLRGETVWAAVTDGGELVKDAGGRVEIFYKPGGKPYRASASNLEAALVTETKGDEEFAAAAAAAPPARAARGKTAATHAAPTADEIIAYTDGACTGNPGPMGIGVVLLDAGARKEVSEFLGAGTNNIAELTAIWRAITLTEDARPIRIHTDSSYAIGVLSMGWKAKANQQLIADIKAAMRKRPRVTLIKVAGHSGVPENERCDELARTAITRR